MLGQEPLLEKLNEIFSDVLDEDLQLKLSTTAQDVDGWDSLAHIRLMLSVERAFKTRFSAADISSLKNVGDLVSLIQKRAA